MAPRLDVEYGLDALVKAARKLIHLDPGRFLRVLLLCQTYLAIYEEGPLSPDELLSRCEMISPRKQRDPS